MSRRDGAGVPIGAHLPSSLRRGAAVMLALCAATGARAQEAAGYVASVHGTWFTSSSLAQPVSPGRVVASGEEVWAAPRPSAGAYLTVVLRDGSRLALSCAVPGDCDRRHTLRLRGGLLQDAARMVDAVMELVRRRPEGFVSLISRADPPGPSDVVVAASGAGIDVSAALSKLGAGEYAVALERPGPAGSDSTWDNAFSSKLRAYAAARAARAWAPGQPFAVRAVPPGLYLLRVESAAAPPAESWVLVVPASDGGRTESEFARAQEMVGTWTGMEAAHDARVFLRAYLVALAGAQREREPR